MNKKIDTVEQYHLEIKVKTGNKKLISDAFNLTLEKVNLDLSNIVSDNSFNHYEYFSYHGESNFERLNEIANLIENVECVDYCCVVPDLSHYLPPKVSMPHLKATRPDDSEVTPSFLHLQTYLNEPRGMNVKNAWSKGINGSRATVRHLDIGLYRNHENFIGSNITVATNISEDQDCNHGTASAGIIAAAKKEGGVTGIAHGCQFHFYVFASMDLLTNEAQAGDIVSLDAQFSVNGKSLPAIHHRVWWERIKIMVDKGATVILPAGNGGLDLSQPGIMDNHGDSGSILVGGCYSASGERFSFSNYGHETSLLNSWGEVSVATTGYGKLFNLGKNRSYTGSYSGTSSATALCAGALALVQDYAMSKNTILSPQVLKDMIKSSDYTEGVKDGIGYRPNVRLLFDKVDDFISSEEDKFYKLLFSNGDVITNNSILDVQKEHDKVLIKLKNDSWAPEVFIPDFIKNGQIIKVTSVADKITDIFYNGNKLSLKNNQFAMFYSTSNIDVMEDSFNENDDDDDDDDFYYIPIENNLNVEKSHISDALKEHDNVGIKLQNRSWAKEIHMPDAAEKNKKVKITSSAAYKTSVFNGDDKLTIESDGVIIFDASTCWVANEK